MRRVDTSSSNASLRSSAVRARRRLQPGSRPAEAAPGCAADASDSGVHIGTPETVWFLSRLDCRADPLAAQAGRLPASATVAALIAGLALIAAQGGRLSASSTLVARLSLVAKLARRLIGQCGTRHAQS